VKRRIILVIMDGWGLRDGEEANAVKLAKTPVVDHLWKEFPHTTLDPAGTAVGLPEGQMGNSEVGHLNLGAGRVVFQDLMRISRAIENGDFFENQVLRSAVEAVQHGGTLHLVGLVSDGGVHSHEKHLLALLDLAGRLGVKDVRIHAFMDGRDTSPTGGIGYLGELQAVLDKKKSGRIASIMGRYFAMDRDKRWDRIEKAFDAMTVGAGNRVADYKEAMQASYEQGVTDEFIEPIVVVDAAGEPIGRIKDGDAIIFFNFRADRARQITRAFTERHFNSFDRKSSPHVKFVCMTEYDHTFSLPVAFPPQPMKNILGEVASLAGCTSLRIAETEKYAHVTYFFNGGNEVPFAGEDRVLIPSPKVATYDLKPEMSAAEVTETLIGELKKRKHDFIICNFANPDMVGHTGSLPAAIKAVETVDKCVGRVIEALDLERDAAIVTADHGNAETMVDPNTGGPHTAHTTNPVPCILVDRHYDGELVAGGSLKEIAPTICSYLGIPKPKEMTGQDLRATP
jgi:2,3-bisphosphoglycerate-independent phosphoglycerate mutase